MKGIVFFSCFSHLRESIYFSLYKQVLTGSCHLSNSNTYGLNSSVTWLPLYLELLLSSLNDNDKKEEINLLEVKLHSLSLYKVK